MNALDFIPVGIFLTIAGSVLLALTTSVAFDCWSNVARGKCISVRGAK